MQAGHPIRLRAEMRVPGKARLEFETPSMLAGATVLNPTAFFAPKGLLGLLYCDLLYPIDSVAFSGTVRKLAEEAEAMATQ